MTRFKPRQVEIEKTPIDAAFLAFPNSLEQKQRLARLLSSDSVAKQVLTRYCQKTEAFTKAFHGKIGKKHIPASYRQGESLYLGQAQKIIENTLQKPNDDSEENEFCWRLYAHSCARYFQKKYPALGNLIAELYPKLEIEPEANKFFESLCKSAYDSELEDVAAIRELYELMWVDRLENFEALLKLATEPDPTSVLKKSVDKLATELVNIQSKVNACMGQQSELKMTVTELRDTQKKDNLSQATSLKDANTRFSKIEQELHALTKQLAIDVSEREKTDLASISARNAVEKIESRMEKTVSKVELNTTVKSIESKLCEFENLSEKLVKMREEFGMALDLVKGDLNEIREMALNIPQSPGTNAIAYRSPLSSGNTEGAIPFKVNNEKVFLDSWFTCLARNYEIAITPEQLLAFHSVYSANRVVMTDRNLLSAWLDCLGWKRFVKHIVASPLWSKEEDWREGAEFVFEDRKDKLTPRILIIHNFDIGILDCYLSPTLLLWSLKARSSELTKIFLIPAESAIPSLTTALMEHAAKVDIHDIAPTTKLRVEGSHWQVQLSRGTLQMGVEPKIWLQWSKSETKSNFDLKSLEKPLSLNFGDFAAANFFATANLARKFLDEDSAAGVAMHHNLLPWLMSKFPESEFDAKRRLLYDFPNLRY